MNDVAVFVGPSDFFVTQFNAFKVELAERTIVRGLLTAMDGEER